MQYQMPATINIVRYLTRCMQQNITYSPKYILPIPQSVSYHQQMLGIHTKKCLLHIL